MEDFSSRNKIFHPALDTDIGKVMIIELFPEINTFVLQFVLNLEI